MRSRHGNPNNPPPSREEQLATARSLDENSTVLINFAVKSVKKHPVVFSSYALGLVLCLFVSGIALTAQQQSEFQADLQRINYKDLDRRQQDYEKNLFQYNAAKGWFSCDATCQYHKENMERSRVDYEYVQRQVDSQLSDAKAKLGLLSTVGVVEARDMFWTRFAQGKQFAQRQTKWDALFVGMRAMGRDESLVSYMLELLMKMLFNFTLGMIGTVVGFIFSLYSIIRTYQAAIYTALFFFFAASLAAISFAMTWMFLLYGAAAGTVYVGAKMAAANMRLERGEGDRGRLGHRNYND